MSNNSEFIPNIINATNIIAEGSCGERASWQIVTNQDNAENAPQDAPEAGLSLIISGEGKTRDYPFEFNITPWREYRDRIASIKVEDGIVHLGNTSFKNFSALTDVTLPEGLGVIGSEVFSNCTSLKSIHIPEGVRVLGPKAFNGCTALEEIWFPSTLKAIDFKAFKYADALRRVFYNGTKRDFSQIAIAQSSLGNISVTNADISYKKTSPRYDMMINELKGLPGQGDGRLHIIAPDLTVENIPGKSGDLMLMIFPGGSTMLIDAGAPNNREPAMTFIKAMEIKHLDWLVITHPHADHIGNAREIARYIYEEMGGDIGEYLYTGLEFKNAERALTEYLVERAVKINRNVRAGDGMNIDGVELSIFNPTDEDVANADLTDAGVNNTSIGMKFVFGKSTFLTSGDLYASKEIAVAEKYGEFLRADIMKANHHTAFTSTTDEWLAAVSPKMILSLSDDSGWTLMNEKLAGMGITDYRVNERGLIDISIGVAADYQVRTEY